MDYLPVPKLDYVPVLNLDYLPVPHLDYLPVQEAPRRYLDATCAKTIVCFPQIEGDPLFRVGETRVTLTIVCILQQLSEGGNLAHTQYTHHRSLREAARTPTV